MSEVEIMGAIVGVLIAALLGGFIVQQMWYRVQMGAYNRRMEQLEAFLQEYRTMDQMFVELKDQVNTLDRWLGLEGKKRTECIPPRLSKVYRPVEVDRQIDPPTTRWQGAVEIKTKSYPIRGMRESIDWSDRIKDPGDVVDRRDS